ncbi:MAG: SRPBCC domain-containing protein [Pseudomonadota bacterium]
MALFNDNFVLQRSLAASPARLYAAYADTAQRQIWSAPNPETRVVIETSSLRDGGREAAKCGAEGDLRFALDITYHRVVPDQLICFSEVLSQGEDVLTAALVTFAFVAQGPGAAVTLTDQVTSFVGPEAAEGHRQGYASALANLERFVLDRG